MEYYVMDRTPGSSCTLGTFESAYRAVDFAVTLLRESSRRRLLFIEASDGTILLEPYDLAGAYAAELRT